jgi:hypothetical protein
MRTRALAIIGLSGMLAILESGCGSVASAPPPLSVSTASLPDGFVAFPYSQTIQAAGGVPPYKWTITSGNLPDGLALGNDSSPVATITGTPDTAESAIAFSVQVVDARNQSATESYTINIRSTEIAQLRPVQGSVPAATVEIQGLSAGPFNPAYWQQNTLNWVPDVRMPMFAAQITGPYQNIYAPWPLELPNGGWRMFYGGWDGQDVPFDEISSTSTTDFLTFGVRDRVIAHGAFLNVNNVNVQQLPDGSFHMICTGGEFAPINQNFPLYFSSPDGSTWNGAVEPYSAQLSDIINVNGYSGFSTGDFNGANVLLNDNGTWVLYFVDSNNRGSVYRATASSLPNFQLQAAALATQHGVNDVKKIVLNGTPWYLMGLVYNAQSIWYSLSNDGTSFTAERTLFNNWSVQDLNIVALGFVMKGNSVLGALYGATSVPTLDQNEIFGRWLQKKVLVTDSSGTNQAVQGAFGPDRQWLQTAAGTIQGTIAVYAEDGVTPLGTGPVNLSAGTAYQLVLTSNGQ